MENKIKNLLIYKLMYLIAFAIVLTITTKTASAQRSLRYDDIYESLDELTEQQAFYRLLRYQEHNPYFANTYVQLGNLSEIMYNELDPLRDYHSVMYWTSNALLYYGLFVNYLDDNDVRRNREYYQNIDVEASGRRLSNADMVRHVNERVRIVQNHRDSISLAYETFETSKAHYNHAVRLFNEINHDYDNLKEVLLQTDLSLLEKLDQLEREINACVVYWEKYKTLLDMFPLSGYNQQMKLQPIKTFRLDGLINSDFLLDTFSIWDYGAWVNDFREVYQTDIISLREEVKSIQTMFNANMSRLRMMGVASAEMHLDSYDDLFFYRLGVYDNNSLVRELFSYLDSKQEYMLTSRNPINNPNDSSSHVINQKLRFHYHWARQLIETSGKLHGFYKHISPERVRRFREFFDAHYGGLEGLENYFIEQQHQLPEYFELGLDNFHQYFINLQSLRNTQEFARTPGGQLIPLVLPDDRQHEREDSPFRTNQVFYNGDIPWYVAGYVQETDRRSAFLAGISPGMDVSWLHRFENDLFKEANMVNSRIDQVHAYEGGVMVLKTTQGLFLQESDTLATERTGNRLFAFDHLGNQLLRHELDQSNRALFLHHDDINRQTLMAFGEPVNPALEVFDAMVVCLADSTGTVTWEHPLDFTGNVVDIFLAENKFVLYVNVFHGDPYKKTGVNWRNGANWSFVMIEIALDGSLIDIKPFNESPGGMYLHAVHRISSDITNLIGYSNRTAGARGEFRYILQDTDGAIIYQNF